MADEMQQVDLLEEDTQKGKYMTFQIGKECYSISISYVNEIVSMQPITAVPEVDDYIKGLINLRGKIIPVIDVRVRFGMDEVDYNDRTCIIVIEVKSFIIGLIVEKIAEVDTILEEDIVPPPTLGNRGDARNKYVCGIARNGQSVKLLIDPEKLIRDEDLEVIEGLQDEE